MPVKITVCVGSSCHVRGSRAVLKRFAEIIRREQLEDEVVLVGSFCMERCGEGVNWQIDDEPLTSATVETGVAEFQRRIIEPSQSAEQM